MKHPHHIEHAAIVKALGRGPATVAALAEDLRSNYSRVGYMLVSLLRSGAVVYMGRIPAVQARGVAVRVGPQMEGAGLRVAKRKVYALAGACVAIAAAAEPVQRCHDEVKWADRRLFRKPKNKSGSGVIAGPLTIRGYVF